MVVNLSIIPEQEAKTIANFIKATVLSAGFSKVILGLSGGIDSAVSCSLAVKALGAENICVGLFPYGELNKEGSEDAQTLINQLNIPPSNIHQLDIKPLVQPLLKLDSSMDGLRKGNFLARIRMMLLFDLAKKMDCLVLGTENRTEHLLGYFTRFGDEACDIEPIIHLYKTQVRQLAKYFNIPCKIIDKPPTAGLYTGQTDEGDFGFRYKQADQILYLFTEKKKKISQIISMGFKRQTVEKVVERYRQNQYKHLVPYTI